MHMMQIIDMSKDIMYSVANGEKKLLALINATVSHEMRNPLNSIQSQLIKQTQINEKMKEFIETLLNKKEHKKLRRKLTKLHNEQMDSININMSSSKILNFLVNDILDFSQLKYGIFRKDVFNFNIKDTIEEIIQIQQEKSEFQGINLYYSLENF